MRVSKPISRLSRLRDLADPVERWCGEGTLGPIRIDARLWGNDEVGRQ
jgi:hypothetical protein